MKELLNKANSGEKSFKEFGILMNECRKIFKRQAEGKAEYEELSEIMKVLIDNQDPDGCWRLIFSEDMPYDAMVEYWKYPTILFTAMMINFQLNHHGKCSMIKGFDETLKRALDIVEQGKLTGHGFSSFSFRLSALKTLLQAGVMKFIELYPDMNKAFTELIYMNRFDIAKSLKEGKTHFDFNEEFSLNMEEVLNKMDGRQEAYLFVYGTLMRNNRAGQSYLDDADFKCECTLSGYSLYDLGYYPGIVEDIDGRVKGELYAVSVDKLSKIDIYEAEGSLYKRTVAMVCSDKHEQIDAYVYVYNQSVAGRTRIEFRDQPWAEGAADFYRKYVWYACYGSNISRKRFMRYIMGDGMHQGCSDKTPPVDEKPIILKHPIYFSNHSRRWGNKGVAFLDMHKKGRSYGKMYLITKEQFDEIHRQEGNGADWYNEKADLGFDGGIPIWTITHAPRYSQDVIPGADYLGVIKKGIQETYPNLKDADIDAYLIGKYLDKEKINVLSYLRSQEHGVTIKSIMDKLNKGMESIISIIYDLKEAGLIRQDGRSINAGAAWNSIEAVYYTMPDKRNAIDKIM